MPVTAARLRRHVLPSLIASTLFLTACPPVRAQAPATVAPTAAQPLPATSAVLIVDPPAAATPESDAQWRRRIQTHVVSLASEHNLRHALSNEDGDARKTQWFKSTSDPAERAAWLRDHLRVRAVPGTALIELALPDVKDPAERRTLLLEIGNTYLASRRAPIAASTDDRVAVLQRLREKVNLRLQTLAVEKQQKQVQLNASGSGVGLIATKEIELSKLVGEQIDAANRLQKATATYDAANAAVRDGRDPAGIDGYVQRLSPYLVQDEAGIRDLETQVALVRGEVGEDNPKYKAAAKGLELRRAKFQARQDEARAKARVMLLDSARSEAEAAKTTLDSVNKRVESLKAELADLNSALLTLRQLQEEEKGLREQVRLIQEQIDQVMASRAATRASDIHWHFAPEAMPAR